jgi:hypothetical protein
MGYVIYGNNPTNLAMHYFLRPGKQPQTMYVPLPLCLSSLFSISARCPTITSTQSYLFHVLDPGILGVRMARTTSGRSLHIAWRFVHIFRHCLFCLRLCRLFPLPPPLLWLTLLIFTLQCFDGRTSIAVWEVSPPREEYFAKLTITQKGMAIVTEVMTSLIINRMCQALGW